MSRYVWISEREIAAIKRGMAAIPTGERSFQPGSGSKYEPHVKEYERGRDRQKESQREAIDDLQALIDRVEFVAGRNTLEEMVVEEIRRQDRRSAERSRHESDRKKNAQLRADQLEVDKP